MSTKKLNAKLIVALSLVVLAISAWLLGTRSATTPDDDPVASVTTPVEATQAVGGNSERPLRNQPPATQPRDDAGTNREEWLRVYTDSRDLYAFVEEALQRGLDGDHRAQYFIGQALAKCTAVVVIVNLPHKDSFAANVEETLAPRNASGRRRMTEDIGRCERFFASNPLAELPDEQQKGRYWSDRALAGRDAFALVDHAMMQAVQEPTTQQTDGPNRRTALLNDVREAVTTRDPAVIFKIGGLFSSPTIARDSVQGPAWLLAACSAGYDCSTANPNVGFGCAELGVCNGGFTIPDQLQASLPPAQYAAAYAASQDILYRIKAGDWEALNPYLESRL